MTEARCPSCSARTVEAGALCESCRSSSRPGLERLRELRRVATSPPFYCPTCACEIEAPGARCSECEEWAEAVETNEEASNPLALPFVALMYVAISVAYEYLALNSVDDWVAPSWLNPGLVVVAVLAIVWSGSVLIMMQNDPDRWVDHPKTRPLIRRYSLGYMVFAIVLIWAVLRL